MTHGSLFSGIGGFDLAAEWMGWENIFHCEINPFGQKVLHYYWPKATQYNDIKQTDFTIHRGQLDILSGGFPCQPYSTAGKRLGKEDDRHLWPEMLRAIREIQPRWVVGENVRGLTNWNGGLVFDEVQADLENAGYEVLPFLLPACAVNAPHRRDRIWFVAHAYNARTNNESRINGNGQKENEGRGEQSQLEHRTNGGNEASSNAGLQRSTITEQQPMGAEQLRESSTIAYTPGERFGKTGADIGRSEERTSGASSERIVTDSNSGERCERRLYEAGSGETERYTCSCHACSYERPAWDNFPTQSPVRSRNDGLSGELVGITLSKHRNESIKAYGNAIVPQVVFEIFKAIQQYEIALLT